MYTYWTGTNWVTETDEGISVHLSGTGQYPPKTDWPDVSGKTVELNYSMFGIEDDGTLSELSLTDYLEFINGKQNTVIKWAKDGANDICLPAEIIRYNQKTTDELTEAEYDKLVSWAGDPTCGAGMKVILRDSNGDIIYDSDGEIVFVNPE